MNSATRTTETAANERLVLLSGALTLAAGINKFSSPVRVSGNLSPGLKVVVLLSGRLQIRLGGHPEQEICGPAALVIKNFGGHLERDQVFAPDVPIRYALVQMDETTAGNRLVAALGGSETGEGPCEASSVLLTCPANQALQSLARQIMTCPIRGFERDLYLGGKALQLAALAIAHCLSNRAAIAEGELISLELESIGKARELLIASMREPLSLPELARKVGLNVHKLNRGFRKVYGSTVYGFLQEYRLEQAYKLLASGEMNVSEAAYHVGYGAAHFATIFRERFGISPSQLL